PSFRCKARFGSGDGVRAWFRPLIAAVLGALAAGCPGTIADPAAFLASASSPLPAPASNAACDAPAEVFANSCVSCHRAQPNASGNLDLNSPGLLSRLINVSSSGCGPSAVLVVPGNAVASYLYQKVAGGPACGAPMPLGGTLTADQAACVASWINALTSPDAG